MTLKYIFMIFSQFLHIFLFNWESQTVGLAGLAILTLIFIWRLVDRFDYILALPVIGIDFVKFFHVLTITRLLQCM
jgi:hypothetical protein